MKKLKKKIAVIQRYENIPDNWEPPSPQPYVDHVSVMAVSELPGNPNAVCPVKLKSDEEFDAYIIASYVNASLFLSIGETVEQVTDSGFLGTPTTLACAQIGDDALVQGKYAWDSLIVIEHFMLKKQPVTCSPKHNLFIGISPRQMKYFFFK